MKRGGERHRREQGIDLSPSSAAVADASFGASRGRCRLTVQRDNDYNEASEKTRWSSGSRQSFDVLTWQAAEGDRQQLQERPSRCEGKAADSDPKSSRYSDLDVRCFWQRLDLNDRAQAASATVTTRKGEVGRTPMAVREGKGALRTFV